MCLTGHMRNKINWMICRMITFSEKIFVVKMCNFLCSVSSQQKFEVMSVKALGQTVTALRQIRVTAQFYLENKRKYILEVWGHADPKDMKRRKERESPSPLASFFICFFLLPLGLPCVNGLARRAVYSPWGPHSGPWTFLCSIFAGFSLLCLLATAILDFFFLF